MRALLLVFWMILGLAGPTHSAEDAQSTIRAQIEAIGRDDAAAAYDYAAPGIQRLFPDPSAFMGMVRNSYAAIHRHKSFEFGESGMMGDMIVQRVDIVDNDGVLWAAIYMLEPQPNGGLKIAGCTLMKVGQAV